MTNVLQVTISVTRNGDQDYMQIMSADQTSINIILVADRINVQDSRGMIRIAKQSIAEDKAISKRKKK